MLKDLLAKYYQDNKERLQKRHSKNIKVFSKKKKQQYGHESGIYEKTKIIHK